MSPSEYADRVAFLGERFLAIERRFEGLEQQVATLRSDMLAHFDELYRRLEGLEQA
jgi:hypothetical protein